MKSFGCLKRVLSRAESLSPNVIRSLMSFQKDRWAANIQAHLLNKFPAGNNVLQPSLFTALFQYRRTDRVIEVNRNSIGQSQG